MNLLLLKLLLAHAIGDFVLQPNAWVQDKRAKKHQSKYLYYHISIHVIALLVVLQFNWKYWPIILFIALSHFFIDLTKLNLENERNGLKLFIADQIAHIIIILVAAYLFEPTKIDFNWIYSEAFLALLLALISITSIIPILIKYIMHQWVIEDKTDESLNNAGKYIGILERLFVFGFIVLNQWQAIGLLIAAKSVFRFGDLSKAKDRKLTEYVLIGTLLSFGLATLIGLLYQFAISQQQF